MTAKQDEVPQHQNISIRLVGEEFERYKEVLRRGRTRNPLADKTKVIRELLGLQGYGLLKPKDLAYFRGSEEEEGGLTIFLGEEEQKIIRKLAIQEKATFEDQVRDLVLEALMARGLATDRVDTNVVFLGDRVPKMVRMPLLGEIAAGLPIEAVARNEKVDVPETFVKSGRDQFVLRARGDSMIDEGIHDGALIVCDSTNTAKNGDMVVALIDNEQTTVKKLYKEKNRIRLQPANKLQKPIYVKPEQLQIQGVVVGIIRHRP
jgi:repressor LexA